MNARFSRLVVAFAILPCILVALAVLLVCDPFPALAQTPEPTPATTPEEEPTTVPSPTHTSTLTPTSAVTATVLVDALNLRAGPATSHAKLGMARTGDVLTVHGKTANCAWLRVSTEQAAPAWVSGNIAFIRLHAPCASVALATPLPIPTPTPLPTLPPTAEPTVDPAAPNAAATTAAAPTATAPVAAPADAITAAAPTGAEAATASPAATSRPVRPDSPPPYVPDPSALAFVMPFLSNPDYQEPVIEIDPFALTEEELADFFVKPVEGGLVKPAFAVDGGALACTQVSTRRILDQRLSIVFERVGSGQKITVTLDDVIRDKVYPETYYSVCLQPGTYRYSFIDERGDRICVTTGGEFAARAGDVLPEGFWNDKYFEGSHFCFS